MSKVTELTDEIINDYMNLSGMRLSSPDEYMLFRNQAIKEIDMRIDIEPVKSSEPIKKQVSNPNSKKSSVKTNVSKEPEPVQTELEEEIEPELMTSRVLPKEWSLPPQTRPELQTEVPSKMPEPQKLAPQKTEKASSGFLSLIDSIEC